MQKLFSAIYVDCRWKTHKWVYQGRVVLYHLYSLGSFYVQVSRLRASRLPGYSASSNHNGSTSQSDNRRPVSGTVVKPRGRSTDTPSSASSGRSTPSTVETDVTPVDPQDVGKTSTKQSATRKISQLRPPKTIIARHRPEHQSMLMAMTWAVFWVLSTCYK